MNNKQTFKRFEQYVRSDGFTVFLREGDTELNYIKMAAEPVIVMTIVGIKTGERAAANYKATYFRRNFDFELPKVDIMSMFSEEQKREMDNRYKNEIKRYRSQKLIMNI